MSQLDLALAAEVSTRHLSFVETGRSTPSHQMVLRLSEVLDVPLRERNALLHAAGLAHAYGEHPLDAPALATASRVLDLALDHHEPYPAVVVDRQWNLTRFNTAAQRWIQLFVEPGALDDPRLHNTVRLTFDPRGLRPAIQNWEEVATAIVQRLHRELLHDPSEGLRVLLDDVCASGVPESWRSPDWSHSPEPLIPLELRHEHAALRLVSTITTLGTPLDVTLQELRIESFYPADPESETALRSLAAAAETAAR